MLYFQVPKYRKHKDLYYTGQFLNLIKKQFSTEINCIINQVNIEYSPFYKNLTKNYTKTSKAYVKK